MATTLADRMNHFSASPTIALIEKVANLKKQGKDVISLNIGEPDFATPDYIKVSGIKAITDNFTKYTPGGGILELREQIAKKLLLENNIAYNTKEIVVSVGAKQAISSAVMVVSGPGDEVIIPVPCWVSYSEMVKMAGATPVFVRVNEETFGLDLEAIRQAVTPRTKAIIICTPNNPTGAVYDEESLRGLAALAEENDFFIISDEIYEKLIYDGERHFSIASISDSVKARTITVNGVSKAFAMTGWRVGYAAGRADVIKGIMSVQSQLTSSTSSISQKAAAAALAGSQRGDIEIMVDAFSKRREYVLTRLRNMPGVTCSNVKGAFYAYPNMSAFLGKVHKGKKIQSTVELCNYLLDDALISTVPGEAYGVSGYIRISYSNSMENLKKGMDRLENALKDLRDDA